MTDQQGILVTAIAKHFLACGQEMGIVQINSATRRMAFPAVTVAKVSAMGCRNPA
jgi:hypothetical protein